MRYLFLFLFVLATACEGQPIDASFAAKNVTIVSAGLTGINPPGNAFNYAKRPFFPTVDIENTTQSAVSVVFGVSGPTGQVVECHATSAFVAGTTYRWTCTLYFPKYSFAGAYKLSRITIRDDAGTLANVYFQDLANDIPNVAPDIDALQWVMVNLSGQPVTAMGTVDVNPSTINGTDGELVGCNIPQAGSSDVKAIKCTFKDPSGDIYECTGNTSVCSFQIGPSAELGYYVLEEAVLVDTLGQKLVYDRTEVPSGSTTLLDVNSTGGVPVVPGPGYDYCGQLPDTTLAGEAYFNSVQIAGTDFVSFNITVRADDNGAIIGIGETNTDALSSFNAAVEMSSSGYFRVKDGGSFIEPRVQKAWLPNVWYKIRIEADARLGVYYAEVADCSGGDDYHWLGSDLALEGAPTTLSYVKAFTPTGTELRLVTTSWRVDPACEAADCAGGTLSVDVSSIPSGCNAPLWEIEPGGYSGTANWGPTPVADQQYIITWNDTIACSGQTLSAGYFYLPDSADVISVYDTDVVAVPGIYTAHSTAELRMQVCLDGNCSAAPPIASWSVDAKAPFSGDYTASGSGDDGPGGTLLPSPTYVDRTYVVTCNPESGYSVSNYEFTVTPSNYLNYLFCAYTTL